MKRNLFILPVILICLLSGCTMAPEYTRPASPVTADWPGTAASREAGVSIGAPVAPELKWRGFFVDERLQKLIETALDNNRDLRLATLNVERARGIYGIQRAELLPTVNAIGSGGKARVPADLSSTGQVITTERYDVNLGITSWEIDFFGRIQSLKDQALEEYLATEEVRNSVQISLASAVAQAYLALAANREALNLAQSTLETQQAIYDLIQKRCEVGIATELDLRRAQTQVDSARGDVARAAKRAAMDENALTFLLGTPAPGALLPADLSSVVPPREISPGIGAEILLGRPDILQAEHRLKGAYANIGAARAAFFPRISLTTAIGTASAELSGLFKDGSGTWSFAPQVALPIFDARIWPALTVSKVDREMALVQYEKAIQTAFRETADALAVQDTVEDQLSAQQSLLDAVSETCRLSNARYTKGIDSYLSVLDAQRSLYAAQQGLIVLRLEKLANQVTLYKVLGGGE
ncbi:MAG: efflux transporter outer membrane subunit [Deltaproteobacteria bacterium]|nr:efflux transporter outer membrane subunit [Deltaproteobacteria bacterium]